MQIQIEKQFVVSTAHITFQDSVNLLDMCHDKASIYDLYPYGYLIHVGKYDEYRTLSLAFQKLFHLAADYNCEWIHLDRDGPVYEELAIFNW
jgi:hypothetical protein